MNTRHLFVIKITRVVHKCLQKIKTKIIMIIINRDALQFFSEFGKQLAEMAGRLID